MSAVDADVQAERTRVLAECRLNRREALLHLERAHECALGVVLVAQRHAEEREQRVAGVLVDVAVVAPDDFTQLRDDRSNDVGDGLGIEIVGERSEPADVGEERRDESTLTVALRARGLVGHLAAREAFDDLINGTDRGFFRSAWRAAVPAEASSVGVLAFARLAQPTHPQTVQRDQR